MSLAPWLPCGYQGILSAVADPIEKLEAAVKKLATDMGDVRKELREHSDTLHEHGEVLDEIVTSLKQIQKTQSALTNAMTTAIKQLGTDKSLEIRVRRLEDMIFSNKH